MLPALVHDAHTGITMAMVATREVAIQTIVDANAVKAKRKNAYLAEVANNLFVGLERALTAQCPAAAQQVQAGVSANRSIRQVPRRQARLGRARGSNGQSRRPTRGRGRVVRCEADADADAFSARVTDAFEFYVWNVFLP